MGTPIKNKKYVKRPKIKAYRCDFCHKEEDYIDYKQVAVLKKYISQTGQILSRKLQSQSNKDEKNPSIGIRCCAKHQRALTSAIKRARHMALLSFVDKNTD